MGSLEYPNTAPRILHFYFKKELGRCHADFMDKSRMRKIVDRYINKLGVEHNKLKEEILYYCKVNNL